MKAINYIVGDATEPIGSGLKVIAHVVNSGGMWGHGFVMALSKKWKQPQQAYLTWAKDKTTFKLGEVQMVPVTDDITVANMIGQVMGSYVNAEMEVIPPVRYEAIRKGLQGIKNYCIQNNASLHCPRLGCNLAGGSWKIIEQIIIEEVCMYDIPVTVYDFNSGPGAVGKDYNP